MFNVSVYVMPNFSTIRQPRYGTVYLSSSLIARHLSLTFKKYLNTYLAYLVYHSTIWLCKAPL